MPRLAAERLGDKPARFSVEAYAREIGDYLRRKVKPEIKAGLEAQVENWDEAPTFQVRISVGRNPTIASGYGIALDAWPTGEHADLWRLVTTGAPPHAIPKTPKRGGYLWFRPGYDSKTKVVGDNLFVGGSGQSSGPLIRKKQVQHPGFEGRRFAHFLMKAYRRKWEIHVNRVLNEARQAATAAR